MRKNAVLFVAYEFPPEGCRGTKRGLKFIKYLPSLGWKPIVLTVKSPNYDFHDGTLAMELPKDIAVYRAFTAETIFHKKSYAPGDVRDAMVDKRNTSTHGAFRRLLLWFYHSLGELLAFADSRFLWLPFAIVKGVWIIIRYRIKVIFASGPSFTNHIVGAFLKKLTGVPLVVDFRDAWVSDPAKRASTKWQTRIREAEERLVIKASNRVVSATDGIRDDFIARYNDTSAKAITITNGFDRADFDSLRIETGQKKSSRIMRIVHAGTLGWERTPLHFLEALKRLKEVNFSVFRSTKVVFVGQNSKFCDGKSIEEYVDALGLDGSVILTGFVSRKESLQYMTDADILLLIIGEVPAEKRRIYGISAKIYDYALTGKPVMTIADEGASADMVRYLRAGEVIHPGNEREIVQCLERYYGQFCNPEGITGTIRHDRLDEFDFRNLSKKLAACFEDIVRKA